MRLTVVGCSGSMSGPASAGSCYLVQADGPDPRTGATRTWNVLLDLGPGAFGALMNHLDPADVDLVVLSHLHADHMVDLIGMHVYRRYHPDGALGPVPVLAPTGALDRVRGVGGDDSGETYAGELTFVEHTVSRPYDVGPLRIESFPVRHPVPAFGVRVTGPAAQDPARTVTLGFTGDTDTCAGAEDLARGTSLLLAEAAFLEGRETVRGLHLTGARAGELAAAAGTRHLVLTHLQPWTDPAQALAEARRAYPGPVDVARPGAAWSL